MNRAPTHSWEKIMTPTDSEYKAALKDLLVKQDQKLKKKQEIINEYRDDQLQLHQLLRARDERIEELETQLDQYR